MRHDRNAVSMSQKGCTHGMEKGLYFERLNFGQSLTRELKYTSPLIATYFRFSSKNFDIDASRSNVDKVDKSL
jgi:hypothetical protein